MINVNITRMSSKGQIVIPSEMRSGMQEGEEFLIIKDEDRIILKQAAKISEQMKEDIEFAKRTEEALNRIESGSGTRMNFDEFLEEMKKW